VHTWCSGAPTPTPPAPAPPTPPVPAPPTPPAPQGPCSGEPFCCDDGPQADCAHCAEPNCTSVGLCPTWCPRRIQ
jgi:hypothetical protein